MHLRVEPHPEDPNITVVWLGGHYVPFCANRLPVDKFAPVVAYAFATLGVEPTPRRVRKDAGPKGVERYLNRHQAYFESQDRKREIVERLTPVVAGALAAYGATLA